MSGTGEHRTNWLWFLLRSLRKFSGVTEDPWEGFTGFLWFWLSWWKAGRCRNKLWMLTELLNLVKSKLTSFIWNKFKLTRFCRICRVFLSGESLWGECSLSSCMFEWWPEFHEGCVGRFLWNLNIFFNVNEAAVFKSTKRFLQLFK